MKRALSSVAYQHEQSLSRQASLHAFRQYCCYHQLLGITTTIIYCLASSTSSNYHCYATTTTTLLPFSISHMYYYY